MTQDTPLKTNTTFVNRFRCKDGSLNEEDYKKATNQFNILETANICIMLKTDEREDFCHRVKEAYFLHTLGDEQHSHQLPDNWLEKVKSAVSAKERMLFASTSSGSTAEPMVLVNENVYKETIRQKEEAEKSLKEKDDIIKKQKATIGKINGYIELKKESADCLYYAIEKLANPDYTANLYTLCERIMDIPTMAESLDESDSDSFRLLLNIAGILIAEDVINKGSANQISKNMCGSTKCAKYVYFYTKNNKNYKKIDKYQIDQIHILVQLYKDNRLSPEALSQE